MNPAATALEKSLASLKAPSIGPDLGFTPALKTAEDVLAFARREQATIVDLTFVDVPGTLQHTSKPVHELEDVLKGQAGFDGSSIRGFQAIEESDMLLMPDPATAMLDVFKGDTTVSLLCHVKDPLSGQLYDNSPRTIAARAAEHLEKSGIADTAYFGPEAEFFVFDTVRFEQGQRGSFYEVDSNEAVWNTGKPGSTGYQIRNKEGYFPTSPMDTQQDLRSEMVREMEKAGIKIETFHHEVATAGQAEIDMERDTLLTMADKLMRYKYIVRNVAARYGKTATFMPKPLFGDNGSGMHVHQSLWKGGQPLFAGGEYAGLSTMALHYMAGLLHHAAALCALCNPTTNSYKRLVPGFEAPVNLIYSARNRSAAIRIPMYSNNPKAKRVEFRMPDPAANPYLAFSALLLAGLDGIERGLDPGKHTDQNLYHMSPEELSHIKHAPATLNDALDALEEDHAFLTKSGVFSESFLMNFIAWKRAEAAEEAMRPTPSEYFRYYDV
ncbi:MAG: glutamine synthetase [Candidatus Peregrinibacteria bacterium Greene0416_19]|nr:MAG: glutamine synthetase [Candidatus Peregrinibacteria bacterium Greene0416_19]